MSDKSRQNIITRTVGWIFKGNYRVKIFFLVLSFFLWLLIKLSKPGYTNEFNIPLEFVNLPQNKLLVNQPPKNIKVSLKGDGFILMKYTFSSFTPVTINLQELSKSSEERYYWLPAKYKLAISSQLADGVEILGLSPDSVVFEMTNLSQKKVPIKPTITINNELGVKLYQAPQLQPDSVLLSGPKEALADISVIETESWTVSEASGESQQKRLALKIPSKAKLRSNVAHTQVEVSLARITEELLQTSISLENVPDSLQVELFPKNVQIRYRVALRDYDKVKPEELAVFANYQEVLQAPDKRFLTLQLEEKPDYIEELFLDPKRVEFIATPK